MAKFRDKSAQEGERYKHEKTDIQDEARKLENEVAMERKRADRYDLAEVFLEIGPSDYIDHLTLGKTNLLAFGIVLSIVGMVVAVTGR